TCTRADELVAFFVKLVMIPLEVSYFNGAADKVIQKLDKKSKCSDSRDDPVSEELILSLIE
ncbi:hypothetical protein ACFLZQ_08130, partial [Thermodesulfobacteriota bacterium]